MGTKSLLGIYGAASCGGCDLAFINIHDKILEAAEHFQLAFAPMVADGKHADLEALPDGGLALTLFNGAIRTDKDLHMAQLLRRKSGVLVAFGACAAGGGVPALANLPGGEDVLEGYRAGPSLVNPDGVLPGRGPHTLGLPALRARVQRLEDVVNVDYTIPGCPPEPERVWEVVAAVAAGTPLPPPGSLLGAGRSSVCDQCTRLREGKTISRLRRITETIPDTTHCLLEQGLFCLGPATRDGCGALCPQVSMPCTGCYGAPEGVADAGAKMVSTLGGLLDIEHLKGLPPDAIAAKVDILLDGIPDWAGNLYKYTLAAALAGPGRGKLP